MPVITNGIAENGVSETNGESASQDMFDRHCDPNNPVVVEWSRVEDAMKIIQDGVVRTPCVRTRLSDELGIELYFKKEYMQFTGSFKDRGALYALANLSAEEKSQGVITTSAGNHAQALAHQAAKLEIPATVVMPLQAPLVKVDSCKRLNANVILHGSHFDEARAYAMAYARSHNMLYINGYDHPDILAGQGTVGVEILEDLPDVDYIIVPIGGGGLVAGISAAVKSLKPDTKIIGVESSRCPGWHTAMKNGKPTHCDTSRKGAKDTIADGLCVIEVGHNSFATASPVLDKVVSVSEDFISLAILRLLEHEKAVVEGAGASGFAAILATELPELNGKKVACVLSGGNIDVNVLGRVIDRALMMDGRLCRFNCTISDRAGGLSNLLQVIASAGASVRDILHDRMSLPSFVYKTKVRCTVETRGSEHSKELHRLLLREYGSDLLWKID